MNEIFKDGKNKKNGFLPFFQIFSVTEQRPWILLLNLIEELLVVCLCITFSFASTLCWVEYVVWLYSQWFMWMCLYIYIYIYTCAHHGSSLWWSVSIAGSSWKLLDNLCCCMLKFDKLVLEFGCDWPLFLCIWIFVQCALSLWNQCLKLLAGSNRVWLVEHD